MDNLARVAELFDCQVVNLSVKYLGLHLEARYKAKAV